MTISSRKWTSLQALLACCCMLATLLPVLEARHTDLSMRMVARAPCQDRNKRLATFIDAVKDESGQILVPHSAKTFDDFVNEVKAALDRHPLDIRPIEYIFSDHAPFNPTCDGLWTEFGVASGSTVNLAARFRAAKCSPACPSVHGFDTFTGLPENWVASGKATFGKNMFDQGGFPEVEENVNLIKGLFNESIPVFLKELKSFSGTADALSYLHVDCDLYTGTRDIFQFLGHRIVVGTVVLFDELVNYEYFRNHEIKAMWEWVQASGVKLYPLGIFGPIGGTNHSVELDWSNDEVGLSHQQAQAAAFVVVDINPTHDHKLLL